ncbi:MAG: PorP/SprF family type IX secretion system membrane protein [Bacteroidota bacterium]|nr:PorP/SprF family type IX secretion system membrane protein [Bacteroidota bacterium]
MNKLFKYSFLLLMILANCKTRLFAQDPVFSQFYSSPLSINPALAGSGNADWRVVGNQRNQWIASGVDPLTTTSLSFDGKIFKQKGNDNNYWGGGVYFLQDKGMAGAYKSSSLNLVASSHVSLDEDDINGLSIGIGANYSTTYIDYSQLTFSQQLSSGGFNRLLPTNETSLSNVKPYFSTLAGITYTYSTETSNFDIGFSGYRFIKTNRSALNDPTQLDPPRYNFNADYLTYLSDKLVFNSNLLYVMESNLHTYILGVNFGNILDDNELPTVLNTGLWYKEGGTLIPYLGLSYKNIQGGLTYDINMPSSNNSLNSLQSFEFSLSIHSLKRSKHNIPCPWK